MVIAMVYILQILILHLSGTRCLEVLLTLCNTVAVVFLDSRFASRWTALYRERIFLVSQVRIFIMKIFIMRIFLAGSFFWSVSFSCFYTLFISPVDTQLVFFMFLQNFCFSCFWTLFVFFCFRTLFCVLLFPDTFHFLLFIYNSSFILCLDTFHFHLFLDTFFFFSCFKSLIQNRHMTYRGPKRA